MKKVVIAGLSFDGAILVPPVFGERL